MVPDPDDVALADDRATSGDPVDEGPVPTAEVDDVEAPVGRPAQLGVVFRHQQVVDHDVVAGGATDPKHPGQRSRREVTADWSTEVRLGSLGASHPLGERGQGENWTVRVAEVDGDGCIDRELIDALAVEPGASGAAAVLEHPPGRTPAEDCVSLADSFVVDAERGVGTPSDDVFEVVVDDEVIVAPDAKGAFDHRRVSLPTARHPAGPSGLVRSRPTRESKCRTCITRNKLHILWR